ncbi:MAG: hypothetical protein K2M19_07410 [Muribaculaceae bacterium]|nr:hypothetical protein [Muribaculaceae bacterium]
MKAVRLDTPVKAALMADSACRPDRRMPLFVPEGAWTVEIRPAVRVGRLGKAMPEQFAGRHIDAWGLVAYLKPAVPDVLADMTDDALCTGTWNSAQNPSDAPMPVNIDGQTVPVNLRTICTEGAHQLSRLSAAATFKTGDIIVLPHVLATFPGRPDTDISATMGDTILLSLTLK